jgi:hypothetical protein
MAIDTSAQLEPQNAAIFYKPPVTPSLKRAEAIEPFRFFLYFARFPVWSQEAIPLGASTGKRLDLTDLRFGIPGRGSFHCVALENERDQILGAWFTFGSGTNFGRGE